MTGVWKLPCSTSSLCSFPFTFSGAPAPRRKKKRLPGKAVPINVTYRKKARKWRGPKVYFHSQIWIVSANKRDDTTQQIKPLNISLPTWENPWPPTIASKKMRAAINHALSWPENFHRRGCLRFFCCLGETYLCKYRGIAWSPNSWWDPANWPYPPNKRHWTSQPANKLIHDGTKISLLFSKLKSHIICQSFSKQNSFCQAIVEAPFGPSGGPGGATVGIVPSPDAEWTSSDASRALWRFEIVCKVNPIKHLRYDTMYTYRTIYIHMYLHKFDLLIVWFYLQYLQYCSESLHQIRAHLKFKKQKTERWSENRLEWCWPFPFHRELQCHRARNLLLYCTLNRKVAWYFVLRNVRYTCVVVLHVETQGTPWTTWS